MTKTKTKDETPAQVDTPVAQTNQLPAVPDTAGAQPPTEKVPRSSAAATSMPVTGFANLAAAISQVSAEIAEQRVVKRGENTFHHYKYATMQDILQALTPLTAKHGIVIMQTEVDRGFMDNGAAIFATYEFVVMHKSGEVWPFPQKQTGVCNARANNGKFDDKAINKCHTAARKYFLLALFQIPTEDEDDADAGHNDAGVQRTANRRREPDAPAAEAEPPPPPVKKPPHEIPTAGMTFLQWGGEFVAQINFCETIADIERYITLNKIALDAVAASDKAIKIHQRIQEAVTERRLQLS